MDKLWERAKEIIPGGNCLYSKRPEYYSPNKYPVYYQYCESIYIIDTDGNEYIDMSHCGVGTCTLGYRDKDVDFAVDSAMLRGNFCTLNNPEEVELAELLLELHPWADMVRFARTGGEAMAIAVRIARTYIGEKRVLISGYHGWHEKDWGDYNWRGRDGIAARVRDPLQQYPQHQDGVTIYDEITTGMRVATGGMHLTKNILPDMAVFAKAMSNGYPFACVIGRKEVMEATEKTFISSTYWTDKIGTAAALATIKRHRELNVPKHLKKIGAMMQKGWKELGKKHGLDIKVSGIPALSRWDIQGDNGKLMHTFIVESMLKQGFLTSNQFYPMYTHTPEHVEKYFMVLDLLLRTDIIKRLRDTKVAEEKPI